MEVASGTSPMSKFNARMCLPETSSEFAPEKEPPGKFGDSYWKPSFFSGENVSSREGKTF